MKEVISSLITVSFGTALLSSIIVSDKFKGNIRALSSLIIVIFIISFTSDLNNIDFSYSNSDGSIIYDSSDIVDSVIEELICDNVKKFIIEEFPVRELEVKVKGFWREQGYEIQKINIEVDTDIPLVEIMTVTEKEFDLKGKVYVAKLQ